MKNFGELMSTDFEVERSTIETLRPNSENTHTSSAVDPKVTCTDVVFVEVGFLMIAEKSESAIEYTRISSLVANKIRSEFSDHMNQRTLLRNSVGKLMIRMGSSDSVALKVNLAVDNVAMWFPLGDG